MIGLETKQKPNFRGWVPQDACQKRSKFDLQETPRRAKMKTLYYVPKNTDVGYCLKAPTQVFGDQNGCLCDTCRTPQTIESSSSIFQRPTIRFAWFCNRRPLLCAPRNRLKEHFFTCCADSLSEATKSGPRTLQMGPQNSPLEPVETP